MHMVHACVHFPKKNSRFWGKVTRSGDRKQGIFLVRPYQYNVRLSGRFHFLFFSVSIIFAWNRKKLSSCRHFPALSSGMRRFYNSASKWDVSHVTLIRKIHNSSKVKAGPLKLDFGVIFFTFFAPWYRKFKIKYREWSESTKQKSATTCLLLLTTTQLFKIFVFHRFSNVDWNSWRSTVRAAVTLSSRP